MSLRVLTCAMAFLVVSAVSAMAEGKDCKSMTRGGDAVAKDKGTAPRETLVDRIIDMGDGELI